MTDPEFLDLADVLLIHEEQLARYGGSAGLRDQGLLESAIGIPRSTFGGAFVHERRLTKEGLAEFLRQWSRVVT